MPTRVIHLPFALAAVALLMLAFSLASERPAEAVGAVENLAGCTSSSLPANDDGSTSAVPLAFSPNFFGTTYNQIYVNNNGNVTFDSSLSQYTADSLLSVSKVIVAPFWADVDTRGASNTVKYGPAQFSGRPAFCVNWVNVGYFSSNTDKLNSFQLIIVDRSDVGAGDFDMVFNYDKIQWETGDASGGTNGLGGSSARMGYSNGSDQAFEYPGSAVNGAFLDASPSGLSKNSLNSTVTGRYIFSVRGGAPPGSGSITGTVYGPPPPGGSGIAGTILEPLANATVTACAVPPCSSTITNDNGEFTVAGLDDGFYRLIAYPPPGRDNLLPVDVSTNVSGGPVNVGQLDMDEPTPTPPGSSIDSIGSIGGAPVLDWSRPSDFSVVGCEGGSGTWTVTDSDSNVLASGTFSQSPPGQYNGTIPPLSPYHGPASVNVSITNCPDPADNSDFGFSVYIDPSGNVRTLQGTPIAGATVTLYRGDTAAGPFTIVPNGSNIMSPSNRTNPDVTDAEGFFHWDTIAGYYIVRAEFAGCTMPGSPGTPYNETGVLPVPPPQLNLEIRLDCGTPAQQETWGDADCSGSINPVDSLKILRNDAGLSSLTTQGSDCPSIGASVIVNAVQRLWADGDCSGSVNPVDSLKTLRFDAGLSAPKNDPTCPDMGQTVNIGGGGAPPPTSQPTNTPTAAPTATPTPTATAVVTATPSPTPQPTATPAPTIPQNPETDCPGSFSPIPIPDNDPGNPVVLTLNDPGGGVLTDLDICININHTWVGDLFVEVEHIDTGTTVVLIDRPGVPGIDAFGCGGDNIRALLADEAASMVENECGGGTPTINGAFRPDQPLSAFDGEVFDGTWEIRISDHVNVSDFTGDVIGATFFWEDF